MKNANLSFKWLHEMRLARRSVSIEEKKRQRPETYDGQACRGQVGEEEPVEGR